MNAYRLSTLEIKHMIEQSLLPHRCEWAMADGGSLTLTLTSAASPQDVICMTGIKLSSLASSRAISELVGEARYLLSMSGTQSIAFADQPAPLKHWK